MEFEKILCPNCNNKFIVYNYDPFTECTCDCPNCNSLLLLDNTVAYDFHKRINETNSIWPEDGSNTYSVEIGD